MMEENDNVVHDNERLGDNINHTESQDVGYSQFQGPEEIRPSFLPSPASFNPSNSVSIGNNQFSVPTGFVTGPPPGYQTQSKMVMETEPMENMGNPMTQPPFFLPPPHFGMRAGHMPPMRMFDHFNHPPPDMMPRPRTTLPPPSAFYQDPSMFNLFRPPILPPRHEVNDTDGGRFNHFYNHKTNEAPESKSSVDDNMTSANKEEYKNTPGANESLNNKTNAAHQFMDPPTTSDPEVATSETFNSEVRQDLQTSGQQMAMPQSNRPVVDENLEKMAADWSEHRNEMGRVYYYNSKTMESTWEMPAVLMEYREKQRLAHSNGFLMAQTNQISAEEEERMKQEAKAAEEERKRKKQQEASKPIFTRAVPATPWCMVWTKDGRIFFHNPSSGTSLWNCPPDLAGRSDVQMWMAEEPPTMDQKDSKRSGSPIMKKQKMGSEAPPTTAISTISSTSHFPSLQNVQQTGYPPNFQGIHHHQQNQMIDGDTSKQTIQVNESNSATLDKSSSEEKLQKFMELLEEKQVSVFSTWEKELPKLVFDPRYLMLPAKERRPAFEQYLRTRCDEERKEKLHKMKVKKDEFKRLLLESNMTGKWTFLDFCSKFSRDERFKAIEKMKERESLFNEFIIDVRKREKMGTKNALEHAKKDFTQMLKEKVPLGLLRPGNHWQDARVYVQSDSRYRLVMHHPTQAGEWYREMCNSGPQEEGSDEGELVDEIDEKMRKERVRQERVEASLRERQKAVQESLYASLMERDKERKTHMREESVQHFKALMADMVKSADVSWRDTRHALRKDDRWALAKHLEREEKEQLFEEHVANLTKKNRMAYHKLLDETLSGSLTTTWKEIRKKIRDDPRCTKFSSHEKKREKEFDEYLVQRRSKAKQEFKDLLRETRLINHRAAELASETGQQQMKDIVVILQKDKRYLVLDSMPEERMDILISYINELSKRAPSPPPTASDPRSRNPIR